MEGFRREKKGKLFYFSNTKGSNIGEEGGFYCGGFRRARRTFPVRAQAGGGGVPAGSRVGFVRVVGVLLAGLFQRGDREDSSKVAGKVLTKKNSFFNGVGVSPEGNDNNGKKKIESTGWSVGPLV